MEEETEALNGQEKLILDILRRELAEDTKAAEKAKAYTIAIPRKFWFAKKYKAKAYFLQNHINTLTANGEQDNAHIRPWLVIVRLDDSKLYIPNIENVSWIVYPSK